MMSYRGLALALVGLAVVVAACSPAAASVAPMPTPAPTIAPSPVTSPQAGGAARVSGTVKAVEADKITLNDGTIVTTTPRTRVSRLETITPADLKTGQYVAVTAKRQTDNTLLASAVNVFDESLRGTGPGQRPMAGGNLMTNATIDQVNGDTFTVTWDGGGARIKLAPDAKVGKIVVSGLADVKVGGTISAQIVNDVAQSISLQ
jgi:hypothetical protein